MRTTNDNTYPIILLCENNSHMPVILLNAEDDEILSCKCDANILSSLNNKVKCTIIAVKSTNPFRVDSI